MSLFGKLVVAVLAIFAVSFVVLFYLYFGLKKSINDAQVPVLAQTQQAESVANSVTISQLQSEIDALHASSEAQLTRIEVLEKTKPTSQTISAGTTQVFQKQIVHIGSANTTQTDWTNTGVEVTLNSADYPSGVNATFEAGLSIIGGEAWARLVNKTTGAIMTITEVSAESSATIWKSSPHFKLFAGTNMYEVQVKSSSGELANISSARIILNK